MKCSRVQDAISPYLDGRLTGAEMLAIRQHLETCRACAEEFAAIQRVKVYLASLPRPLTSETLEQRILSEIGDESEHAFSIARWSAPRAMAGGPPHARRLATTLALSCVGLLAFAMPFGQSSIQTASRARMNVGGPLSFADADPVHFGSAAGGYGGFALRPPPPQWPAGWASRPGPAGGPMDVRFFSLGPSSRGSSTLTTSLASYTTR